MKRKKRGSRLAQKFSIKVFLSVCFTRLPARVGIFYAYGRVGSSGGLRNLQKNTTFFKKCATIAVFRGRIVKGVIFGSRPYCCLFRNTTFTLCVFFEIGGLYKRRFSVLRSDGVIRTDRFASLAEIKISFFNFFAIGGLTFGVAVAV